MSKTSFKASSNMSKTSFRDIASLKINHTIKKMDWYAFSSIIKLKTYWVHRFSLDSNMLSFFNQQSHKHITHSFSENLNLTIICTQFYHYQRKLINLYHVLSSKLIGKTGKQTCKN